MLTDEQLAKLMLLEMIIVDVGNNKYVAGKIEGEYVRWACSVDRHVIQSSLLDLYNIVVNNYCEWDKGNYHLCWIADVFTDWWPRYNLKKSKL